MVANVSGFRFRLRRLVAAGLLDGLQSTIWKSLSIQLDKMTITILPYLEWPLASGSVPHRGAPTPYGQDGPDQGVAIPNQNSAKLSVWPCFARVRFRSPVFCPFFSRFRPFFAPFCHVFA